MPKNSLSIERIALDLLDPVSRRFRDDPQFFAVVFHGRPKMKEEVIKIFEGLLTVEMSKRGIVISDRIDLSDFQCQICSLEDYKATHPGAFFLIYNPNVDYEFPSNRIYTVNLEKCLDGDYL